MRLIALEPTDVETWAEAKFLAKLDYELLLGTIITVEGFTNYIGHDSVDHCEVARARLEKTSTNDINHSIDEYLDPYWNIEALSHHEGESAWTFGPTYRVLENVQKKHRLPS